MVDTIEQRWHPWTVCSLQLSHDDATNTPTGEGQSFQSKRFAYYCICIVRWRKYSRVWIAIVLLEHVLTMRKLALSNIKTN